MKLSTKGRYAMRIMLYLASRQDDATPARKQDIAAAEGLSADYVEQILIRLKAGGLVASRRGAKGGFALDCPLATTTVAAILQASEGTLKLAPDTPASAGSSESVGILQDVWAEAEAAMQAVFERHTLETLVACVLHRRELHAFTYSI